MDKLNGLDLFSGIGGITKAVEQYVDPITYCDNDRYAQAVLLSRMQTGDIPNRPIWDDITTLNHEVLKCLPPIDIIYGGFPCQDISCAGRGEGLEGKRSGLFFEVMRLAQEIKPTFLFLENVPAIRTRGLNVVVERLAAQRYDCRWCCLSAAEVGAPHLRKRWFLLGKKTVAYSDHQRRKSSEHEKRSRYKKRLLEGGGVMGHANGLKFNATTITRSNEKTFNNRGKERPETIGESPRSPVLRRDGTEAETTGWPIEPNICRVANGIPRRVDRIKSLGNSVVPKQAKKAFEILMGF